MTNSSIPPARTPPPPRRRVLKTNADGSPRKRPVDWEGNEQAVLMRWLLGEKMRGEPAGQLYDATYHVPNGGQRSKSTGAAMKRQGVKSGVSDLVVMDARGGWHGLYMEFKASPPHTAALAESQREWLARAEERGYCAVLAVGLEEAKRLLDNYACLGPSYSHYTKANIGGTDWRKG
ncbi:VRR-NUC domain-containing protein [Halomonas colorata]|uniref:VRR-NUC domain-containing protein n=1 Tax=Halomonas colorata TaxID=2742615 RepID=UPI00186951BB|nr:VRR-NUC domain-containing protein [Halomonas colorata]